MEKAGSLEQTNKIREALRALEAETFLAGLKITKATHTKDLKGGKK
jgi:hypothetical protein